MKRMLALALCAVLLAGGLAACKQEEKPEIGPNDYTSEPAAAPAGVDIPVGWVAFGTIDGANAVTVHGLTYLRTAAGDAVAVSEQSAVTANLNDIDGSGEVSSVTVDGRSIPVMIEEISGLRTLYAEAVPADEIDDDDLIDLTTTGSLSTTKPAGSTTKPLATAPPIQTTKKPEATTDLYAKEKEEIMQSNMTDREKQEALKLLGYKMDKNGIFYVEHEPWQKQFGFNQIYDLASPLIQLVYGTVRVKFRYGYVYKLYTEGTKKGQVVYDNNGNPVYETDTWGRPVEKDWMIQMWKGRYGLVMLGAEIGVYTKSSTQTAEHYNAAVSEEELVMAMDVYQHNFKTGATKYLFTRGPESAWWLTGFVPGSFYEFNKKAEVILVANIQFPSTDMMNMFAQGMRSAGFSEGAPSKDNPETYRTSGTSLKFSWQNFDQDA